MSHAGHCESRVQVATFLVQHVCNSASWSTIRLHRCFGPCKTCTVLYCTALYCAALYCRSVICRPASTVCAGVGQAFATCCKPNSSQGRLGGSSRGGGAAKWWLAPPCVPKTCGCGSSPVNTCDPTFACDAMCHLLHGWCLQVTPPCHHGQKRNMARSCYLGFFFVTLSGIS
jgi:hypothetical protein